MNSILQCPNCGGLLFGLDGTQAIVQLKDGSLCLIWPLRDHSCEPEKAYVMEER